MKNLSFHYHLKLNMTEAVTGHHFTLRCTPSTDERQKIETLEHFIAPSDFLSESRDQWGNATLYGACRAAHSEFEANICGHAVTGLCDSVANENPGWEHIFRFQTSLTKADEAIKDFADFNSGDTLETANAIMEKVSDALVYTPGATDVNTTASQVLELKKGVCQDYSQLMISVLREKGIPCRYVVGIMLGEGKSHAWVEVLNKNRWYAFDPTNRQLVTDKYIKLSHGRDYWDCNINKGLFRGQSGQTAEISAIVNEN